MEQQNETDQQIIDRVLRNGRRADYARLVDRYGQRLFAFVATMVTRREDAEELAQDCFVKAFRQLSQYDDRRSSFYTWLRCIAYRLCLDRVRHDAVVWPGVRSVTSTPQIDTHKKQTKKILTPTLTPPLPLGPLGTLATRGTQEGRGKATGRRPKVGNEAARSESQENVSIPKLTAEATHASAPENQAPSDAPDIVPPDRQALADIYLAEAALQVAYRRQAQAEALRAYAISFEEEDAAPAQPIIAF